MKKLLLFISFCLMINYLNAQNEMWIYKSSGSVIKYNTSEIDSIKFMPAQEPEDPIQGDAISTLTSDYEIDLSNCTGSAQCCNDYWKCGYCNWVIEFICNDGFEYGTYLVLDLLTDSDINGTSSFEGTYRPSGFSEEDPSKPNFTPHTFVPGFRIIDNYMMGTLLMEYSNGVGVDQAPIFDGEISITANSNGTHTIIIDATDDANPSHKVTLNWTGILQRL